MSWLKDRVSVGWSDGEARCLGFTIHRCNDFVDIQLLFAYFSFYYGKVEWDEDDEAI